MDLSHVTLASDDESNFKHTKVFLNKNHLQCYHNNRGYCSFADTSIIKKFAVKQYAENHHAVKDIQ